MVLRHDIGSHSVCASVPQLRANQNGPVMNTHTKAYLGQKIPVEKHRVVRVEVTTVVAQIGKMGREGDGTGHNLQRHGSVGGRRNGQIAEATGTSQSCSWLSRESERQRGVDLLLKDWLAAR